MSSLFPPIINTYMPIQAIEDSMANGIRIYFALSQYNSKEDIKNAQVIVNDQKTNKSVLSVEKYPNEIKITDIVSDEEKDLAGRDDKYYIEIESKDLQNEFQTQQYFKVQIRFTSMEAETPPPENAGIGEWLTNNLQYFSEWSTVCLIRFIEKPTLNMTFPINSVFETPLVVIQGKLLFEDNETETLKEYKVIISDHSGKILIDSGFFPSNIYNNNNEIYFKAKTQLDDGNYTLKIEYKTRNQYESQEEFLITVQASSPDPTELDFSYSADIENGKNNIHIVMKDNSVILLRSDGYSNFKEWEELQYINNSEQTEYYDCSIESGVPYKYAIQEVIIKDENDKVGIRKQFLEKEPIINEFADIFLNGEDRQLKATLNGSVSSFRRNVTESKIDTLGGVYPIITKNAASKYRTFSFSGTISYFSDKNDTYQIVLNDNGEYDKLVEEEHSGMFTSKKELLGDALTLRQEYNLNHNISDINDSFLERKFREMVMDFLYDFKPKLFKSMTEGNILVKLMDISFTPNRTLSNHIYDFTCNAVEIAEATIDNLNKYGIQLVGTLDQTKQKYIHVLSTREVDGSLGD